MGVMIVMADEERTRGARPGDYWGDPIRTEKSSHRAAGRNKSARANWKWKISQVEMYLKHLTFQAL